MGTTASAKIIAIPIMEKPPEPATPVAAEATAKVTANASPAAPDLPVPAPEPIPTVSLRKVLRGLSAKFTRERFITDATIAARHRGIGGAR